MKINIQKTKESCFGNLIRNLLSIHSHFIIWSRVKMLNL